MGATLGAQTNGSAAVALVQNSAWSPSDDVREGASEFKIFLTIARLQADHTKVGVVSVGNQNGRVSSGAERALDEVALRGVIVAKVATKGGSVARLPDSLFIDAGGMTQATASALLQRCLERYGPAPAVVNASAPTATELDAIRDHLRRYQEAFSTARSTNVAQN